MRACTDKLYSRVRDLHFDTALIPEVIDSTEYFTVGEKSLPLKNCAVEISPIAYTFIEQKVHRNKLPQY